MSTDQLNELPATEIVQKIATGSISAEAVTQACLDRISAREDAVKAWAYIDPAYALTQARILDDTTNKGPLHGLPIGVKDVIDTSDMPTQMQSSAYEDHQPKTDAACVAILRAAGAVILGKTVTCEFAGSFPGPTTNPHNPSHTPGGSSSGSGAAVADYMVHGAFGTQTGGSVLRPASFCGTVGYKPTYNLINRSGLMFAAENLDTIGLLTRTIDDADLLMSVLLNRPRSEVLPGDAIPKIGLCRTHHWESALPETIAALDDSVERLTIAGAEIVDIALPSSFADLSAARNALNDFERSRVMADLWQNEPDHLSDNIAKQLENGTSMEFATYQNAVILANDSRAQLDTVFGDVDFILAPSATGEAPEGLSYTGDPQFQGCWTILHVPTISLPTHLGPNELPVGIQLVGRRWRDETLLSWSRWVVDKLGTWR
ncbi:MAG: amidase [Alphaproteobacteria bacterium]|nr:amidase [Alphaproteobacteria bacterium]